MTDREFVLSVWPYATCDKRRTNLYSVARNRDYFVIFSKLKSQTRGRFKQLMHGGLSACAGSEILAWASAARRLREIGKKIKQVDAMFVSDDKGEGK